MYVYTSFCTDFPVYFTGSAYNSKFTLLLAKDFSFQGTVARSYTAIGCAFQGLPCSTFDCMVTHRIAYVNIYFDIFTRSLFCTIQAVCFCVLSTIGFSSCFLLFMCVNYRLAILFSFLRRFNGVFSAFDSLVVCLYGLCYRGLYGL